MGAGDKTVGSGPAAGFLFPAPGLPAVLREALDLLKVPAQVDTAEDLVAWAETGLRLTVQCCPTDVETIGEETLYQTSTKHRQRHRVSIDPHTGTVSTFTGTRREADRVAAGHMLAALASNGEGSGPSCRFIEQSLATRCGSAEQFSSMAWHSSRRRFMHAVRTVVRAVQFHDAGLDLQHHGGWIALGVTPALARFVEDNTPVLRGEETWLAAIDVRHSLEALTARVPAYGMLPALWQAAKRELG